MRKMPKEQRKLNHKKCCIRYERTLFGYLMRKYRNMKSRVNGVQKLKWHLYKGLELLPKDEFYEWAMQSKDYKKLYKNWINSGRDRKLAPSVDRIDSSKGYFLENMRWVTHSENSKGGCTSQRRRKNVVKK